MLAATRIRLLLPIMTIFTFVSCKQCPVMSKFIHHKNTNSSFQITDLNISLLSNGPNAKNEFNINDKIRISFDVKNLVAVKENNRSFIWIRQDLSVKDLLGNIVLMKPGIIDIKKPVYEKPLKFTNDLIFTSIKNLKPGKYTATLLVTDLIGFNSDEKTINFTLK